MTNIHDLTEYAKNGELTLRLDPEQFDELIKACDVFIDGLRELRVDATDLATHPLGFAEDKLTSGAALARKFQQKAAPGPGSAADMLQSHIDRVQEMKALFLAARRGVENTDTGSANRFKQSGH